MPKTAKKGFTYFRFETDHFYDPKVKRLKNKFGMEGWGVFHFIVNEIYRVEGCYMVMDADGLFDISDYSRMDEKKVSDIIDYCAELGLFNKELWQDKQILTSEEIQELYVGICKAIHRKPGIPESILLLETEPSPESATIPHSTCEQQDNPAHEFGSPASLPEDGKEIRQAVTRIRTLFAAEKELREEADKTRENKPYKIKENKISSPTPPAQASGEGVSCSFANLRAAFNPLVFSPFKPSNICLLCENRNTNITILILFSFQLAPKIAYKRATILPL